MLRKKPPGQLLSQTAHKVEREYRIISALGSTDVPVPRTYCLCEDDSVVGTPFYVMEFLDGRILENPAMPGIDAGERTALWHAAIDTLARLHRLRPESVGLEGFGKSSGFYDRQIRTWSQICASQAAAKDRDTGVAVGQLPHFEEMMTFFKDPERRPKDQGTLIHGDYKIDNLVFHKTEPRVIGILEYVFPLFSFSSSSQLFSFFFLTIPLIIRLTPVSFSLFPSQLGDHVADGVSRVAGKCPRWATRSRTSATS